MASQRAVSTHAQATRPSRRSRRMLNVAGRASCQLRSTAKPSPPISAGAISSSMILAILRAIASSSPAQASPTMPSSVERGRWSSSGGSSGTGCLGTSGRAGHGSRSFRAHESSSCGAWTASESGRASREDASCCTKLTLRGPSPIVDHRSVVYLRRVSGHGAARDRAASRPRVRLPRRCLRATRSSRRQASRRRRSRPGAPASRGREPPSRRARRRMSTPRSRRGSTQPPAGPPRPKRGGGRGGRFPPGGARRSARDDSWARP